MKVHLEKVLERDVDFVLINSFLYNKKVLKLFLDKIGLNDYKVIECYHSYADFNGESDVTVILENGNDKIGLLIEDKIDAIAMPDQQARYELRGNSGVENGKYNRFYTYIVAPNDYIESNSEAKKYPNKISYEELLELIHPDDILSKTIIQKALEQKQKGYSVIENKNVTNFWKKYYEYISINYPELNINNINTPRGDRAQWPLFKTPVDYILIYHKADRGYIDLTFPGVGNYYSEISKIIGDNLDADMSIQKTGKSMAVRINGPEVNFNDEFENYLSEVKFCLDSVVRLQDLLKKIDYKSILSLKGKDD